MRGCEGGRVYARRWWPSCDDGWAGPPRLRRSSVPTDLTHCAHCSTSLVTDPPTCWSRLSTARRPVARPLDAARLSFPPPI